MLPSSEASSLLAFSTKIAAVGVALQSLELLALHEELGAGNLLGWHGRSQGGPLRRLLQRSQAYPAVLLILLVRAVAAVACLFLPQGGATLCILLGGLALLQLYYNRRFELVFANSDNMALIVLATTFVGAIPLASDRLKAAALGFLAFQAVLAYAASGIDKLFAGNWRSGRRLVHIFADSAHRFAPLGRLLAERPKWATGMAWSVIALELVFPLGLLLPTPAFVGLLALGLSFHAVIAVIMGLPGFFWMFAATYPGMYFVQHWLAGRLWS